MIKKIMPNQIIVMDEETGIQGIWDVDPEEFEFLKKRARIDETGRYVISFPLLVGLKRWNMGKIMEEIEDEVKKTGILDFDAPQRKGASVPISELHNCSNKQLEELLSFYGSYRAYLDSRLSLIEAKKSLMCSTFDEGLAKISVVAAQGKRINKDLLRARVLGENPKLKALRQQIIQQEALFIRFSGLRNAYRDMYETVSRIISLRTIAKEEL